MPITVTTPLQGDAVGPGTIIRAETFSVLPVGHHWDALVFEVGKQDTLVEAVTFQEGQSAEFTLGVRRELSGLSVPIFQAQPAQPLTAGEFDLHVRVISAESTIIDTSGPIGINWRPDAWGTAYVQSLVSSTPVTGGFTETDRVTLNAIPPIVTSSLPFTTPIPATASVGLEAIQRGPPIDLLSEGEQLLLSGRGTLTRASGSTGVYAYGGRWSIESAPAGLGRLDGQAVLYEQRITQFVIVKARLGGGNYAWAIEDSHYDSGEISWPIPFPVRIDYDILPGVVVRWRWLLFLQ